MKKVLSLVLALAMVLGSFSFVSAAPMSDVTEPVLKKAVDRLSLLEVLTGYPDGTFKPEQTITRAEFAAVAVRVKGLEDAANAAKGLATGFTDVAPTFWASGYVGTAGKLGIVNGVGNGLFAPNAPVKYEEAITMIVRALGYEAEAQVKGGYPYGYLIVANDRGLLDDVKGTQGTPASRGIVAQITDNALEIPKMIQVGFGSDAKWVVSGSAEHGDDAVAQYLLHDLGVKEIKGHVTNTFRTKSTVKADEVEINNVKYDIAEGVDTDAVLGTGVTAWAKDDVVFSISLGYKIRTAGKDIVFDEDQVIYDRIVAKDTNDDEAYLYKLDDEYDWANKARVFVNNEDVDAEDIPDRAYGRFVLNEDDEIEFAYLFDIELSDTGLVTEIDKTDLDYVNLNADDDNLALDDAEEIYVFNKDLSAASLDDIKEDTAVFYWIDEDDNYYIVALNETAEGTLEAVRVRDSRITVEGNNFKFEEDYSIYSLDDKDEYELLVDFEDIEDYVDEDVIVYLNLVGDAIALVTDTEATTSKIYGVATWLTSQRNPVLSVYTQEGKEVDYTFEETDDIKAEFKGLFPAGEPTNVVGVGFRVNKDGEIKEDSFEYSTTQQRFNKDDNKKYGAYNAENLYITEDTVVLKAFNSTGKLKPSVIKYENIINKEVKTDNKAVRILVKDKGNDLALLVFTESAFQAVDDTEYGIVTSDPTVRGTTYRAEIDVYGKGKETYVISKTDDAKALRTGDLVAFRLNDKGEVLVDAEVDFRTNRDKVSVYEKVSSKSGDFITTNADTYRRTTDTVIYAATKSGALGSTSNYSRIAKDSILLLIADSDDELKAVLDITAYREGKTASDDVTVTGVVTHLTTTGTGATYSGVVIVDGKTNYYVDSKTVVTDKDDIVLFIGDGIVIPAGYKNDTAVLAQNDQVVVTAKDGVATTIKRLSTLVERNAVDALKDAKDLAADEIEANNTPATWAPLKTALAMTEKNHTEIIAKEAAITIALGNLVPSTGALLNIATEAVEDLEDAIDAIDDALAGNLTNSAGRGALQDAIDAADDLATDAQTAITAAGSPAALVTRRAEAIEAIEVAEDILAIYVAGIADVVETFTTEAATITAVETAVATDADGITSTVTIAANDVTWTNAPAMTGVVAAADYEFEIELTNGTVTKTITITVNVEIQ